MSSARAAIGVGFSILLLGVSACSRDDAPTAAAGDSLQWARDALARNPAIEVVAVDPAGVFTVRDRASGELSMVRVQDLVAAPATATTTNTAPAPTNAANSAAAASVGDPAPAESSAGAASTTDAPAMDEVVYAEPAPTPEYVVTRDAGRVSIVGKGVAIASADTANTDGTSRAGDDGAGVVAPRASGSGRIEQRGNEPIVCQGARSMRIDDREIRFSGDGLIVEDGCQLYLTNSRIEAGGVAIVVTRGDVHIVNSTVSGAGGAIEASLGARVFLSSASIDGLQRRFDTAQINDLGNNRMR
jgi:hypothetical protein